MGNTTVTSSEHCKTVLLMPASTSSSVVPLLSGRNSQNSLPRLLQLLSQASNNTVIPPVPPIASRIPLVPVSKPKLKFQC